MKSNEHFCVPPETVFTRPGELYKCDCGQPWYATPLREGSAFGHYHKITEKRYHELIGEAPTPIPVMCSSKLSLRARFMRRFHMDEIPCHDHGTRNCPVCTV